MSIRQKRPARSWAAAAVVIGSATAVMASPLALGTAAAAPVGSISITTTSAVAASGPTATAEVDATYSPNTTPAPDDFYYAVTAGGDKSASNGLAGTKCTPTAPDHIACSVANTSHAPTTDTVVVFEDTGTTAGVLDAGDVKATPDAGVPVVFSGPPTGVTWDTTPANGTTGTCAVYTAHATGGSAAGNQPLTLTVNETTTGASAANPITLYKSDCTTVVSSGGNASSAGGTSTYTTTVTTAADGTVSFGISTSAAGHGTLKLSVPSSPNTATAEAPVNWSSGGDNSVTNLTVSAPTSTTQLTGTTASFVVTATNGSSPVQGVTVKQETDPAASPANADSVAPVNCGTTNSSGQVTCTVHNGGTAGVDKLIFWVENSSGSCSHTAGPDSCEPQATATATFNAAPAVDAGHSSVTCEQGLTGADKGLAKADCTVPTSQHSVDFTATVKSATGTPISGAPVTFAVSSAKLGGVTLSGGSLPAGATVNTDANGVAKFTVNNPTPAALDTVTVSGKVGAVSIGSATAHWVAPAATALNLVPSEQSVTVGGVVTVKATVVDQFGNPVAGSPSISYFVTGRNNAKTGNATSDGTITYTDAGGASAPMTDTIAVSDNTDHLNGTAKVNYVTGTTTPTKVTIDTSGQGVSDATCSASGHSAATAVAFEHVTKVCATVKNEKDEPLSGQSVTFTVDKGQVAATGGLSSTSGKTYQATTDTAGVAFADVTSTTTGAQTVTATAGSATASSTVTYNGPAVANAYAISLAPASGTVSPGAQQKFTATVTDKFGNPVSGVSVGFTQSGPGSLSGASSASVTTGADGTASVTLGTTASDTGSGSITATIATTGTQCASATTGTPPSSCSTTATYTVGSTNAASELTLSQEKKVQVGDRIHVTATASNADHSPAANVVVRVFMTGANTAATSGTTDASGVAHLSFLVTHHGTDHLAGFVDSNNDQIREADEPQAFATVRVQGFEHPSIHLTSKPGKVTVHVTTHPKAYQANVRYYVKRHGHWHLLGHNRTSGIKHHGTAHKTFHEKRGSHRTFRVKVSATSTTTAGKSPSRSIHVKR